MQYTEWNLTPKKNDTIIAMLSDLGESVNFEKPVVCAGGVEIWLNTLLEMVKETVKTVIAGQAQLLSDPEYDFIQGFIPLCAQVSYEALFINSLFDFIDTVAFVA